MFDLIRENQMDIMLALCSVCFMMALMLLITRFLPLRRKLVLINMEILATLLLAFDRMAYIYSGGLDRTAYVMVRVSNFMVFFLTSGIVFGFNLFLLDLLDVGVDGKKAPFRLKLVSFLAVIGMLLVIVSQFTGLIYSFDGNNRYYRGPGFLLSYVVPVICPIIQYTVILQNRKKFSRFINIAYSLCICSDRGRDPADIFIRYFDSQYGNGAGFGITVFLFVSGYQ